MTKYRIHNASNTHGPCYMIRRVEDDEMVAWCRTREEAERYVRGTLAGELAA